MTEIRELAENRNLVRRIAASVVDVGKNPQDKRGEQNCTLYRQFRVRGSTHDSVAFSAYLFLPNGATPYRPSPSCYFHISLLNEENEGTPLRVELRDYGLTGEPDYLRASAEGENFTLGKGPFAAPGSVLSESAAREWYNSILCSIYQPIFSMKHERKRTGLEWA